jgi:hypothetical protein
VRDTEATTALRSVVRARRDLVAHRVGVANQLRSHLQTVYPGAASLFRDISLRFLERFDTQDKADWLSAKRLAGWLRSVGDSGRSDPAALHAKLAGAPRGAVGEHANPWAADLYTRARARGHDHLHAVRILARAWTHIIWRCWHDHTPYDPAAHGALQRILNQDQPAAARHRATHRSGDSRSRGGLEVPRGSAVGGRHTADRHRTPVTHAVPLSATVENRPRSVGRA